MKITSTLHNHCTLCDGRSTPDEMVEAAIACGFTDFGMSCHGYTPFDLPYSVESEESYLRAMEELREKYRGRIRVWCGVEQEYFAPVADRSAYDYIIGSCHYVLDRETGGHIDIDGSDAEFARARDTLFGGDVYALAADYFKNVVDIAQTQRPDILGHFDLISKNNGDGRFFDEDSKRYRDTALEALCACADTGVVFEVNTGAIARGNRSVPYPPLFMLKQLKARGARLTLTADCHDARHLLTGLYEAAELLKTAGYRTVLMWEDGAFAEKPLD